MPRGVGFKATLTPAQFRALGDAVDQAIMDAENHGNERQVALLGRAWTALSKGWWAWKR